MLAREDAGASEIIASDGIKYLLDQLKENKDNDEVKLGVSRIFASLSKGSFKRVSLINMNIY